MKLFKRIILLTLCFPSSLFAINPLGGNGSLPQAGQTQSTLDGWRLGLGTGFALYVGDQMDYTITRKYGEFKELRPNFTFSAFKQIREDKEWGLVMKLGSFQSLKSSNTQGIQCDYQELQSVWHKSLNDNIDITGKGVTVNLQYGIGLMYYKSMYFNVNPNYLSPDGAEILSSVGYGYDGRTDIMGNEMTDMAKKRVTFIGNLGLSLGFAINRNINIYWENSLQVSSSSRLSGNLYKTARIPPDGYFYTGIGLFYRFGVGGGRLGCPKTQF